MSSSATLSRWESLAIRAAGFAGAAMRHVTITGPSVVGMSAISYGIGMYNVAAGVIAAGIFLLIVDRKLTMERKAAEERRPRR